MPRRAVASAPGKVILTGEHFVVYGEPSLVMAVNRRARAEAVVEGEGVSIEAPDLGVSWREGEEVPRQIAPLKRLIDLVVEEASRPRGLKVRVHSELPISAGMGSSAAVAVATAMAVGSALGLELSEDEVYELALEAERVVHVNPSGVDPLISTMGGIVAYRKGEGYVSVEAPVKPIIVVGVTRRRGTTGAMVRRVDKLRRAYPEVLAPLFHAGGHLTIEAAEALRAGDLKRLGELLNINHGLLVAIGVSTRKLDKLVYVARRAGALGAKLTGAGGGGCMIALCDGRESAERVARAIERSGATALKVELDDEGVRLERLEG